MEDDAIPEIKVSLVMPAYNEEARHVGDNVKAIIDYFQAHSYSWELIIVDDASSDETPAAVAAAATGETNVTIYRNEVNRGKGYSVRRGVMAAAGQYIFFTDADLSTPLEEVDKALLYLERYDVVVGSRRLPGSKILLRQPTYRRFMGRGFGLLARLMGVRGVADIMCGFKGFTRQAAKDIFERQRLDGFAFDVEILYIAKKMGFSITEIPIVWKYCSASRVRPTKEAGSALRDLIKIRVNDLRGLYK